MTDLEEGAVIRAGATFKSIESFRGAVLGAEIKQFHSPVSRVAKKAKDRYVFRCSMEGCNFGVLAKPRGNNWVISPHRTNSGLCFSHNAEIHQNCEVEGRSKNTCANHLKDVSNVLQHWVPTKSSKTGKQQAALSESLQKEGMINMSRHQKQRFVKSQISETFEHQLLAFQKLVDLFKKLRESDPSGFYFLDMVPLSYEINDVEQEGEYMFRRALIMPSTSNHVFSASRLVASVDGARLFSHLHLQVLHMTGYFANNSLFSMAVAIVGQENSDNWEWFIKNVCTNLDRRPKLMLSDKEKGLEKQCKEAPLLRPLNSGAVEAEDQTNHPFVWSFCAIHCAKNAGLHSTEGKDLIVKYAKAGSQIERERILKYIKNARDSRSNLIVNKKALAYLESHYEEISFLGMQDRGLDSCFNTVTSNASESFNNQIEKYRSLPLVPLIIGLMDHSRLTIERVKHEASKLVQQQRQVCPEKVDKVIKSAADLHEKKWRAKVSVIDGDRTCIKFQVWKSSSSSEKYGVELKLRGDDVTRRVSCQYCNLTRVKAHACSHAALCAAYLKSLLESYCDEQRCSKESVMGGKEGAKWWHKFAVDKPYLYSAEYYTSTLVSQVDDIQVPLPSPPVQHHRLWPPVFGVGKGRTKTRKKKRVYPRPGPAVVEQAEQLLQNETAPPLQFSLEGLDLGTQEQEKRRTTSAACTLCGQKGHNAQGCSDGNISYALKKRPQVVNKIKTYAPITPDVVLELRSPFSCTEVKDEAEASCSLPEESSVDAPMVEKVAEADSAPFELRRSSRPKRTRINY